MWGVYIQKEERSHQRKYRTDRITEPSVLEIIRPEDHIPGLTSELASSDKWSWDL
jgi:hypothetical protein